MKRHTKQTSKQALGQYFTTNVDLILSEFETYVQGKDVVDPFAGGWDLLAWAQRTGAKSVVGLDIEPRNEQTLYRDSLLDPIDYSNYLVLTNPPYLAANKSKGKYKDIYSKWDQSDLYKCFLSSLGRLNALEAIVIIPSNFLCESNPKARSVLFSGYDLLYAKYWKEQIFDDATTGVCALYLKKRDGLNPGFQSFECKLLPEERMIQMDLHERYGYIHGGEQLATLDRTFQFEKVSTETKHINTNIVVGCLDGGRYDLGFHYNQGEPIKAPKTVITTFQVNTVGFELNEEQQKHVVDLSNHELKQMRETYSSMFLSNYMGATQKIMSVSIAKAFLSNATKKSLTSL
jgi:hypothetical protein